MENEINTMSDEPKSNGLGGIIGAIIIIVLLIIGGWYFISNRVEKISDQKQATSTTEVGDVLTGDSTEVSDIQADLDNLNLDALDQP